MQANQGKESSEEEDSEKNVDDPLTPTPHPENVQTKAKPPGCCQELGEARRALKPAPRRPFRAAAAGRGGSSAPEGAERQRENEGTAEAAEER